VVSEFSLDVLHKFGIKKRVKRQNPEFKNYEGKQQGFAPGGEVCRNGIVWDTGLVEIF
jgi:hypothetical protein